MKKKPVLPEKLKDCLITAGILSVASIICVILRRFSSTDTHVPMLFVLAVSLTVCTMTSRIKAQEIIHLEVEKEKMRSNLLRSVSHDIRISLSAFLCRTMLCLYRWMQS